MQKLKFLKHLVESDVDINMKDPYVNFHNKYNKTSLISTIQYNDLDIIKYLVENSTDINIKDKEDSIALDFACTNSNGSAVINFFKTFK